MRRCLAAAAAAAMLVLGALGGAACTPAEGSPAPAGPRTVVLTIRYSRFTPDVVRVKAGETIHFVVRNEDPIDHEFIVGPEQVHLVHETGTHAQHGAVPGEISIPPHSEAATDYPFAARGSMLFACHLPGHFAYGMTGNVVIA